MIYDYDGTSHYEMAEVHDYDGSVHHKIAEVHDWDGSAHHEIFSAEQHLLADKSKWEIINGGSAPGVGGWVGDILHVNSPGSYVQGANSSSFARMHLGGIRAKKITIWYQNNKNNFDQRSSYFAIDSNPNFVWYLWSRSTAIQLAQLGNVDRTAGMESITFDFGGEVDLSNYYFIVSTGTQGNNTAWISVYDIIVE